MDERKRAWSGPDLTVLVRGKPEETVLNGCKVTQIGAGPTGGNDQCMGSGGQLCSECFEFHFVS
jgi:hypothetical protein